MRHQLLSYLEKSDLPEDLQDVADVIGMDAVKLLLEHFDGERFYIPSLRYMKSLYERYIHQHYTVHPDGTDNARQLRRDLEVGPDYVRAAINKKRQSQAVSGGD